MIVVVMGVAGSGKTTVGRLLAERLQCAFADADDFHPQNNIDRMRSGMPLTDEDRRPWLETLRQLIDDHLRRDASLVLGCSALKGAYRGILGVDQRRIFTVYLKGTRGQLLERLQGRKHFFPPALLDSQLAALEEPDDGLTLSITEPPESLAAKIAAWLITA